MEPLLELADELYDIIFLAKAKMLEDKFKKLPPKIMKYRDIINTFDGIKPTGESWKTQRGIVSVFEKANVYGNPGDAASYWINKKGRKKAFGEFLGWIITEIPVPQTLGGTARVNFAFTFKEPHIEARKALRRTLKQKKMKREYYDKYLKGNTLVDFAKGKAEKNIKKKRRPYEEVMQEKLDRRKRRDAKAIEKESGS